jgi:glucokinase
MTGRFRLLADLGATHCRLAASDGPRRLSRQRVYPTAATATFAQTLARWMADEAIDPHACDAAMIAAAGPVEGDRVALTNAPWAFTAADVSAVLAGAPVAIVNDLAAVAMLLPHLIPADSVPVWPLAAVGEAPPAQAARIAVNVGTGFGAAAAVPHGSGFAFVSGEPGHMALTDPAFAAGTVEEALSGDGVLRLYRSRGGARAAGAAEVMAGAASDPIAAGVVADLAVLLGRIAGDLVLAAGAWGGVWFTGSVAQALLATADRAAVRRAFEAKGAMAGRMRRVPACRLTADEPALLGLSLAAMRLSR